jgi:medium-chain acyl-[acyl-carrier-protein] hydrolase
MERFANGWLAQRDIRVGAAMRLFCLPHAGSGSAAFYRWKRELQGIDVCPVLLPGRDMRLGEPSITDAGRLADALMQATAGLLDAPYAIFGHSMGALLAYEWAGRIEQAGLRQPICLFVSGREAVHLPWRHRILHGLGDAEFVDELRRRYGGMPEDFLAEQDLREVFLPILRADLRLVETYRHENSARLSCRVMAFAGEEDASVEQDGLARWAELTSGAFSARRFAGGHFYHMDEGQTAVLEAIRGLTPPPYLRA